MPSHFLQQSFLSLLFGKLLVMGEDQTNIQLERQNTSPMQAMIRVFLENPFFFHRKTGKNGNKVKLEMCCTKSCKLLSMLHYWSLFH